LLVVLERALTDFEQVLLGMLVNEPRSGYDLKKLFSATPAAVYQSSPGALYPALRRLVQRGLLRVQEEISASGRARRVYHATEAGLAMHVEWVRRPVLPEDVSSDLGLHLMRFVMMEKQLPRADVLAFLASLRDSLEVFVGGMEGFVRTVGDQLPGRHPLLALGHGIAIHQASLDWARSAIADLEEPTSR
jgi:PadR family transcriptional regulator, regulatory protein AphA